MSEEKPIDLAHPHCSPLHTGKCSAPFRAKLVSIIGRVICKSEIILHRPTGLNRCVISIPLHFVALAIWHFTVRRRWESLGQFVGSAHTFFFAFWKDVEGLGSSD